MDEDEEPVGIHPCDFSSCFWNDERGGTLGRCQLVTMPPERHTGTGDGGYLEIAAYSGQQARDDATNCPRASETDLLPPRIRKAGRRMPVDDAPLETAQREHRTATRGVSAQYREYNGWRPSR